MISVYSKCFAMQIFIEFQQAKTITEMNDLDFKATSINCFHGFVQELGQFQI